MVIYFVMLLTVLRCFGGEVKEEEWTLYKDMVVCVRLEVIELGISEHEA